MKSAKLPIFRLLVLIISASVFTVACKEKAKPVADTVPMDTKTGYSDSSSSSVRVFDRDGRVCIQQTNTYYELVNAYEGTNKIPLLLKIKKTDLCYADSINKDKVYEVSAKSVMDTKSVEWQTQFVATDLQFKDNTMTTVREGADGEEDFLKRFSLLDGKEVFSSSYGEVKAVVPNVKDKRFIGYTSKNTASHPLADLDVENLLGVIRYGSSTGAGNAFYLLLKRSAVASKIPSYTPEMVLVPANENTTAIEDGKSLVLMKADEHYQKSDIKDFALKLIFYYGDDNESTQIIIPVVNDQMDLKSAKYDKDIFDIKPF